MEMVEVGIASKRRILGIAVIHHTALKPTRLELRASWPPSRPWYAEGRGVPALTKVAAPRWTTREGTIRKREVGDRVVVTGTAGEDCPSSCPRPEVDSGRCTPHRGSRMDHRQILT